MSVTYIERGCIVLATFPFLDGSRRSKLRPLFVLHRDAARAPQFVVAGIFGTTKRSHYSSQVHIDPHDCPESGLLKPSCLKLNQLFTIREADIKGCIGKVNDSVLEAVKAALQVVFSI